MSLFRKSPKSPQEVSKALKDALTALERSDKKAEKVSGKVCVTFIFYFFVFGFLCV